LLTDGLSLPATIPSGGFRVSSIASVGRVAINIYDYYTYSRLYSAINLFKADPAMLYDFPLTCLSTPQAS